MPHHGGSGYFQNEKIADLDCAKARDVAAPGAGILGALFAVASVAITYSIAPLRTFPLLLGIPTVIIACWYLDRLGRIFLRINGIDAGGAFCHACANPLSFLGLSVSNCGCRCLSWFPFRSDGRCANSPISAPNWTGRSCTNS